VVVPAKVFTLVTVSETRATMVYSYPPDANDAFSPANGVIAVPVASLNPTTLAWYRNEKVLPTADPRHRRSRASMRALPG